MYIIIIIIIIIVIVIIIIIIMNIIIITIIIIIIITIMSSINIIYFKDSLLKNIRHIKIRLTVFCGLCSHGAL